jgi:type IV pilus assembly protein PilA
MQQMLNNLRARREDDESGFTLIELMVVVLIIAILIAIAIPTFLGAKTRAQDKAAQSSLRNALTNAKGIYTDTDSYSGATPAALLAAEPSLTFNAAGTVSSGAKNVSVNPQATYVVMTAVSSSGKCFAIADFATGGTFFASVSGTCSATTASAITGTGNANGPTGAPASATTDDVWSQAW